MSDRVVYGDFERMSLRDKRIIVIEGDIEEEMTQQVIEDMKILISENSDPIEIIISSDGGDVADGIAISDAIGAAVSKGIKVIGRVYGHAMSMAFLVLQECSERIASPRAWLMAHGCRTSGFREDDIKDSEAELKFMKGMRDQHASLIARRNTSTEARFHKPKYWLDVLESKTPQFWNAKEALVKGVIDKIEEG